MSEANLGKILSDQTRKKMSEAKLGEKNYQYGLKGNKSPNFGKTVSDLTKDKMSRAKGTTIIIDNDGDRRLSHTFTSYRAAAKHFNCFASTIIRNIRSGKIFRKEYILSLKELSSSS